ncbi:hypothetical protein E2562_005613 [Oryza meyeriana var. granulata]|uniref:Uncharacterized protein n=1 Tax=Oryza meyeriana var. granulata TaxID=110450 RepID=A0A6G1F417_9ORYZ|nr:hypothetical protein E2562_005613 [Oryza meyeriana var. granulata]
MVEFDWAIHGRSSSPSELPATSHPFLLLRILLPIPVFGCRPLRDRGHPTTVRYIWQAMEVDFLGACTRSGQRRREGSAGGGRGGRGKFGGRGAQARWRVVCAAGQGEGMSTQWPAMVTRKPLPQLGVLAVVVHMAAAAEGVGRWWRGWSKVNQM